MISVLSRFYWSPRVFIFFFPLEMDCFVFTKKAKIVLAATSNWFATSRAHLMAPEDCLGGKMWEGELGFFLPATLPPTCPNKSAPSQCSPSSRRASFACSHYFSLSDKKKQCFYWPWRATTFLFPVCSALKTYSRAHRCQPTDSTWGEIFPANNKGQPERELCWRLSAEVVLLLSQAGQGFSKGASDACG